MCDIEHEVQVFKWEKFWTVIRNCELQVVKMTRDATHMFPYLTHDGKEVTDSNNIIEFVAKLKNVDVDAHLRMEERAASHALTRMLDESFYWFDTDTTFYMRNIMPDLEQKKFWSINFWVATKKKTVRDQNPGVDLT